MVVDSVVASCFFWWRVVVSMTMSLVVLIGLLFIFISSFIF